MAGIFVGQVGIFPELPMATGGKTKDIDVTAIDETGFWDCEQLALRTSGGEGQRTGGVGWFGEYEAGPSSLQTLLRSGGASSFAKASEDMSQGCSLG